MNSEQMKQLLTLHAEFLVRNRIEADAAIALLDRTAFYWCRDYDDKLCLGSKPDFQEAHEYEDEEYDIHQMSGIGKYAIVRDDQEYRTRFIILSGDKQVSYVKPEPPTEHKLTPDEQAAHDEWIRMSDEKRREVQQMLDEYYAKTKKEPDESSATSVEWKVGDRFIFMDDWSPDINEWDELPRRARVGSSGTVIEIDGSLMCISFIDTWLGREIDEEQWITMSSDDAPSIQKLPPETSTGDTP